MPNRSTWTEWSITSSTGDSGLIFEGSPPRVRIASRIAARSTTAGTPVKSWSRTREGVNAISVEGSAAASHPASASMSAAVTATPSSWRSRFSRRIFSEKGRRARSKRSPRRSSLKISYSAPSTSSVDRALNESVIPELLPAEAVRCCDAALSSNGFGDGRRRCRYTGTCLAALLEPRSRRSGSLRAQSERVRSDSQNPRGVRTRVSVPPLASRRSLSPVTSTSAAPSRAAATIHRSSGSLRGHGAGLAGASTSPCSRTNVTTSRALRAGVLSLPVSVRSSSSRMVSLTRSECSASTSRSTSWQRPRVANAATSTFVSSRTLTRLLRRRPRRSASHVPRQTAPDAVGDPRSA